MISGGTIARATRRLKWPGESAVLVSIVHMAKGATPLAFLDERPVRRVSAYLVQGDLDTEPALMAANRAKALQGSIVLGMGFTFDDEAAARGNATYLETMHRLTERNPRNSERIFPYIGGDELNSDPQHRPFRYVIDFADMSEDAARHGWPDLIGIIEELVRPERQKQKRKDLQNRWWQFAYRKNGLYEAIKNKSRVLAMSRVTEHLGIARVPASMIFADRCVVFPFEDLATYAILQSRAHDLWSRFFSATMEDRLLYAPTDCFETFPFPPGFETDPALEAAGRAYHDHRAGLMVARNEGMTKTYNRFHERGETAADIARLRELHAAMDRAVLAAYGWPDLAQRAEPIFLDESNEDDHTYQGRLFWPSDLRDEILARLLALNAERHAEEVRLGIAPGMKGKAAEDTDGGEE